MVYTAGHLSLAVLEIFVNLVEGPTLREQLYWSIDIPDDVPLKRVERADLPAGWHTYPPQASLQDRGDRWVREAASVGMLVPSAVVPEEWNVLVNPRHEDFERLHISAPQRLDFDERLTRD